MLDHNYIGTEHLLLGLIQEGEGVASKALEELGIRLEAVRQKVVEIIGRGEHAPAGHIPFTPRAKKVLELSLRESRQLDHNYIGTEHILLGLIREGHGVAAQVLTSLGADLNTVRQQVIRLLHGYRGAEPATESSWLRVRTSGRLDMISAQLGEIIQRLAALEDSLGLGETPQPEALRRINERISEVRREKEAAIDAQEFERSAELRDREKELLAERAAKEHEWRAAAAQSRADGAPEAGGADQLRIEVERLRGLLRAHDIDPDESPPTTEASA
jgi:ATP-dependent Clp protease ATP-binding subunit ClpA